MQTTYLKPETRVQTPRGPAVVIDTVRVPLINRVAVRVTHRDGRESVYYRTAVQVLQ